ncbi:alcohol dehydrogenase catalytic domain-containing protein [Streptomyces spiralis]
MDSSTQRNAVTVPEFGGAEVLRVARRPVPEPGPGQVAVDVAYAGANFAEILYRRCVVDVPLPFVPGIEVAGRIRAVGEGVGHLAVRQPVAALTIVDSGGYARWRSRRRTWSRRWTASACRWRSPRRSRRRDRPRRDPWCFTAFGHV